ncbi:MAG: hypothetical protein K5769_07040, partial [Pseudobutyrivibrio sp.]|nr:hypothetical protein [Pseudobutyrivibrio sp.]
DTQEDSKEDNKEESEVANQEDAEDEETEPSEDDTDPNLQIYRDFMSDKSKLSLKYYCDNVYDEESLDSYDFSDIKGEACTLKELIKEMEKKVDEKIDKAEYAYLDCGADGKKELAIKLKTSSGSAPYQNILFIIKDIDGELRLVYTFGEDNGANGWEDINEYGYIFTGGQGIYMTHYSVEAFLDADGKYKYGYNDYGEDPGLEFEQFFEIFGDESNREKYKKLSEDAETEKVTPIFYEADIPAGKNNTDENAKKYFSVVFYDLRNELIDAEEIKDTQLYKDIMELFKDIKFVSVEEYHKAISDRLEAIGATEQIRGGDDLEFRKLDIFGEKN